MAADTDTTPTQKPACTLYTHMDTGTDKDMDTDMELEYWLDIHTAL
jgi:hypothetical protein